MIISALKKYLINYCLLQNFATAGVQVQSTIFADAITVCKEKNFSACGFGVVLEKEENYWNSSKKKNLFEKTKLKG